MAQLQLYLRQNNFSKVSAVNAIFQPLWLKQLFNNNPRQTVTLILFACLFWDAASDLGASFSTVTDVI